MKLNPDCIRDILLQIGAVVYFHNAVTFDCKSTERFLSQYMIDEILYHVRQAHASNLITQPSFYDSGTTFVVGDLTPQGHEFIANIRKDMIWNNVKDVSKKLVQILWPLLQQ